VLRGLVFLVIASAAFSQGLDTEVLKEIDALIEKGISNKRMPGGVLHLEHKRGNLSKELWQPTACAEN
jgi:uncharacterized protein related to proFAR isomerase